METTKVAYIENIKSKLGKFHFSRRLKRLNRTVETHNLNSAKSAGIIFNTIDKESYQHIKEFLSFLSQCGLKVVALGYIHGNKIPEEYLMRKGINFYCKKDLNWYSKPKNDIVEKFIKQKFDILFDLSINKSFTLNYVGALSKASFKVGKLSNSSYHDLSIDISKNNSIAYLIEQIKHYLNILNN